MKLHKARAEHKCSRCDNIINIGEKVAYQDDPYIDIGVSRNEFCEVCFNECGQELRYFKRGRKPIPRSQKSLV
jgi:hypothetical protein